VGAGAINVTGLQPGQRYSFRVVAINGVSDITRETRSDPHTVAMNAGIVYAWHAHFLFSWSLTSLDTVLGLDGLRFVTTSWLPIIIAAALSRLCGSFRGRPFQAMHMHTHNNGTVISTFTEKPNMKYKTQKPPKLKIVRTRHYNCA